MTSKTFFQLFLVAALVLSTAVSSSDNSLVDFAPIAKLLDLVSGS